MSDRRLIDDDGENLAVRQFLALYGCSAGVTVTQMRQHLSRCGFQDYWPGWCSDVDDHLTKAGAQDWLRYLFSLEDKS